MQTRLDLETGVNKPFEIVSRRERIQIFFREEYQFFVTFQA